LRSLMKEKSRKGSIRKVRKRPGLEFGSKNYQLFGIGLLVIILGYVFMTKGPANSFWSLTLSPILLVIGYCLLIPAALLYRPKKET
jgi:uncharacterized membrane protein HdeD (DUF308 family)